ncbi:hypothetical protein Pyn_38732 [Prunus yedoensis var. nudiflora]|uniref:Uncharacterized protein n=1 Tax=Prunus yedoensis var. nudiflora TaxID=2094558 RepID=A0A314UW64_PRUYE|nr:hypothetical protein Pyn_38732 [Prunus yedoensis var. nudiflora]
MTLLEEENHDPTHITIETVDDESKSLILVIHTCLPLVALFCCAPAVFLKYSATTFTQDPQHGTQGCLCHDYW